MDTKLVTANVRLSQWNAIIQDRIHSGMTVDEYCEVKDISRNRYYYWLRKVKQTAVESYPEAFAELIPKESEQEIKTDNEFSPQMRIQTNGLTIEINADTPQELLAMVLEVSRNV